MLSPKTALQAVKRNVRLLARISSGIVGLIVLTMVAGCRHTTPEANPLLGAWKVSLPSSEDGTLFFDESQFKETWTDASDPHESLVITGPYQMTRCGLHLDPKDFRLVGGSSNGLTSLEANIKRACAWDFDVHWSSGDLAYLTAIGDPTANVTMAIARRNAKPDPAKLSFAFNWQQSDTNSADVPTSNRVNYNVVSVRQEPSEVNLPAPTKTVQVAPHEEPTVTIETAGQDDGGNEDQNGAATPNVPSDSSETAH